MCDCKKDPVMQLLQVPVAKLVQGVFTRIDLPFEMDQMVLFHYYATGAGSTNSVIKAAGDVSAIYGIQINDQSSPVLLWGLGASANQASFKGKVRTIFVTFFGLDTGGGPAAPVNPLTLLIGKGFDFESFFELEG
jgi:hypothetical protein